MFPNMTSAYVGMFLHRALSLWRNEPAGCKDTDEFTTSRPSLFDGCKVTSILTNIFMSHYSRSPVSMVIIGTK